jgi:two-component system, NarL family, response regulator NreC
LLCGSVIVTNVFIVDDSTDMRKGLAMQFSRMQGVSIAGEAGDIHSAIDGILRCKPDIVVLDISLPSGSGFEVLSRIKLETPSPIVMMLTNHDLPQYRKRALENGADGFFNKVTEIEKLLDAVRCWAADALRVSFI